MGNSNPRKHGEGWDMAQTNVKLVLWVVCLSIIVHERARHRNGKRHRAWRGRNAREIVGHNKHGRNTTSTDEENVEEFVDTSSSGEGWGRRERWDSINQGGRRVKEST